MDFKIKVGFILVCKRRYQYFGVVLCMEGKFQFGIKMSRLVQVRDGVGEVIRGQIIKGLSVSLGYLGFILLVGVSYCWVLSWRVIGLDIFFR